MTDIQLPGNIDEVAVCDQYPARTNGGLVFYERRLIQGHENVRLRDFWKIDGAIGNDDIGPGSSATCLWTVGLRLHRREPLVEYCGLGHFPLDHGAEFENDYTIVEWLTQYSDEKDVTYVRGFLGRMLFSGDDGVKRVSVLSGGEKVRCMLSKMMISGANVLILDEPTNHLDMESITALNNGMIKFPGVILFTSRDHQIVQTTANRIMEIVPGGKLIDKITTYDEYLESDEMARKRQTYSVQTEDED